VGILQVLEIPGTELSGNIRQRKAGNQQLIADTNMNTTRIKYLPHEQIDKGKWDNCIDEAANGLVYAYSFYLDAMSRNWDALVLDDYKAVMPLTWNKKYGFYYLYQPFLCASLGVFGNHLNAGVLENFLEAIPRRFRYWDIYLNWYNLFPLTKFNLYQRVNHALSLNIPYEELYSQFRTSYKQLLKRFEKTGCTITRNIPVEEVLVLAKSQLGAFFNISEDDYSRFQQLYSSMAAKQKAVNYGVYSSQGELLASGLFLFSHKRAYYILAGNHPNGKTLGASHQVIDSFIKEFAGRDLVLDFEGSNVSRIAFFFKGFNAVEELYPGIIYNRLPPLLRWLKS
jgi:hypothetical protein